MCELRELEARALVDRWNEQLAAGRDMLWSPTIRAALLAEMPWTHHIPARARRIAGLSGFFVLSQSRDGPDRQGAVSRFDTMPRVAAQPGV
jgi:hypothetical protein